MSRVALTNLALVAVLALGCNSIVGIHDPQDRAGGEDWGHADGESAGDHAGFFAEILGGVGPGDRVEVDQAGAAMDLHEGCAPVDRSGAFVPPLPRPTVPIGWALSGLSRRSLGVCGMQSRGGEP